MTDNWHCSSNHFLPIFFPEVKMTSGIYSCTYNLMSTYMKTRITYPELTLKDTIVVREERIEVLLDRIAILREKLERQGLSKTE